MIYLAGVDGGASKTHCIIGDNEGNILSEGFSSGSSYHIFGIETAIKAIESSLREAVSKLGISIDDISYTVLGLASADLESDYEVWNKACASILPQGRFKVLNDTWIGLRAGIPDNWGVVTICGTGGACAGRNKEGLEVRLRNLNYELGNQGGGVDISGIALHYAFRSDEGTGKKTSLEEEIPKLAGLSSLDEVAGKAMAGELGPADTYGIPVLVGELANRGDEVCQNIFINIGHVMGEIASGVIKRLHMESESFQITLVGSVFKSECPLLIDEYTTTVHRTAPFAKISIAQQMPVTGAYKLALEEYRQV